jgi:Protein of unknown function (DUF1559)
MAIPEHLNFNGIGQRVPSSYRGNGGWEVTSDDQSSALPGTKSFETVQLNGIFAGCSRTKMRDITDGTANTMLIGESLTEPAFDKDGQGMDFWYIGSPQIDPCNCAGGTGGTEFSEFAGSAWVRLNVRKTEPTVSGQLMELSYGSYHVGGAQFTLCDGSVRFISENVDQGLFRGFSSRDGGEVLGEF